MALLARMSPDVEAALVRLMRHLSADEHRQLSSLLERVRADQ